MRIFFDLDGTLLDSRERLFRLFQHLVPSSKLSFEDYWELKRNKIPHAGILRNNFLYSALDIARFEEEWMERIERPEWLAHDKPFDGVADLLHRLSSRHSIFLVTARQFESSVLDQIREFRWEGIFEAVFVTGGKKDKYALIKEAVVTDPADWFVGDTGKDIETGRSLGIRTAAVLSGFLGKEALSRYDPDIIVENVLQLEFD